MSDPAPSKKDRLEDFSKRLMSAKRAATRDDAVDLVINTLNAVEDDYHVTGEERMLPPEKKLTEEKKSDGVGYYDHRRNTSYFAPNGAIKIVWRIGSSTSEFISKPGEDGRTVDDFMPKMS